MRSRVRSTVRTGRSLIPWMVLSAAGFGTAEAVLLLARRILAAKLAFAGLDTLWMAPLGYLLILGGMLGLCLVPGLVFERFPSQRCFFFATGFIGVAGFLRTVPGVPLHPLAVGMLGAAIGFQLSRAGPRWLGARWLLRAAVTAAAVVLVAAGARVWQRMDRPGGASTAAGTDRPNILLIVWDTVRELDVSLYGYPHPTTPFLERWAGRGVVFDRAFSTSSWTLPSHASLFTGRFPHELSMDFEAPLDAAYPTLAEVLRARGYRTAGFVGNPYYTSEETGLSRGFGRWMDYRLAPKEILLSAGVTQWMLDDRSARVLRRHFLKRAPQVTDEFLGWMAGADRRPFFAFLNYFDAHIPYYAPEPILKRFAASEERTRTYDAAIAFLDAELERLVAALEAQGILSHTVVVVTSDHGEQFDEHGLYDHANSLYRQVVQVPLVVVAPGRAPSGLRVGLPVSLRNVPATILDLAGSREAELPGESFARFWQGGTDDAQDRPVLSELTPSPRTPKNHRNAGGEIRSLVEGPFHYILGADGTDEMFDLRSDPEENRNLEHRQALPETAVMRQQIQAFDSLFPRKRPHM